MSIDNKWLDNDQTMIKYRDVEYLISNEFAKGQRRLAMIMDVHKNLDSFVTTALVCLPRGVTISMTRRQNDLFKTAC